MSRQRLASLDVMRGITVAVMILVNNAGDGAVSFRQLRHSVWSGCTLTDVVFPTFLFMVGASVALSLEARMRRGVARKALLGQVAKRSLLIFGIGLLLNGFPLFHLGELRLYGVLQRIALCYAVTCVAYLLGGWRACAGLAFAALGGYWLLLTQVPVPGYGMPGRDVPLLDPHGNLPAWLDRFMISPAHLYRHSFYDPEGLLSTIPALANTACGVVAAWWLQRAGRSARWKGVGLLLAGLCCIVLGALWAHTLPMNKRLWTSSYSLFTTGIALVLLALLYQALDGRPAQASGAEATSRHAASFWLRPWLVFGTNALAAYVFSEMLAPLLAVLPGGRGENLQQWLYHLLPNAGTPALTSLLYSMVFVLVCYVPVDLLYRRKVFLRL